MADLSHLLVDISPDAPCGADLEYDNTRIMLNTAIQGTPEDQFSGQKYEAPNWREVQKQTLELLKKSKDLQLILYLIRTLIQLEGICGFRDGLNLLDKSIQNYWDCIFPLLDPDDGDATQRLNILEELCSHELLLTPLSLTYLVEAKSIGRFNLREIHYATDKQTPPADTQKPDLNIVKAVFAEIETEKLCIQYQAITESIQLLQQIESTVAEKVSGLGNGVNLEAIKSLLKEMRFYFEQFADSKLNTVNDEDLKEDDELDDQPDESLKKRNKSTVYQAAQISSRHDVIKTLDLLCQYYAEHEPSSPVPILLQRAKILATASFMEIMQNLVPDALAQIQQLKGPESGSN